MLHRSSWNAGSFGEEPLRIGRCTVRLKRSLGEGGFAFVHLVEDVSNGRELVLKRASLQSTEGRAVYEKEASIMRSLAHPNIVQIVTAVELTSSNSGAILMEYCPGGHLLEILNKLGGKRMDEVVVLSVFCDVVSAVKYLHQKGITHRDIKLENVLRSLSGPHKLCDFGSCVKGRVKIDTAERRANEEEVIEKTTTQMYRAPEMVDLYMERELTEKVDVWALGCVLFALCYLKHPFQDAGNLGILNGRIRTPEDSTFSENLKELTQRTFIASPEHRPSVDEVESCVHALSKGHPLPPSRNPRPPEVKESLGGHRASSSSGAFGVDTGAHPSAGGNPSRDGKGRGGDGERDSSRRVPPGSKPRRAGSKSKEPHLNPNSVAARRLASRKEAKELETRHHPPTSLEHSSQPSSRPPSRREHADTAGGTLGDNSSNNTGSSSEHRKEYADLCNKALRKPTGVAQPPPTLGHGPQEKTLPPSSQQSMSNPRDAPTRSATAVVTGGAESGTSGLSAGWSGFADFDQFSGTPAAAPDLSDGFGAVSFDVSMPPSAAAPADPFAVAPNSIGFDVPGSTSERGLLLDTGTMVAGSVAARHPGEQVGGSGDGRSSNDDTLLLDFRPSERGGVGATDNTSVAALSDKLAGVFTTPPLPPGVGVCQPSFGPGSGGGSGAWGSAQGPLHPHAPPMASSDMNAAPWAVPFNTGNGGGDTQSQGVASMAGAGAAQPSAAVQGGFAGGSLSLNSGVAGSHDHQRSVSASNPWSAPASVPRHQNTVTTPINPPMQDPRQSAGCLPVGQGLGTMHHPHRPAASWHGIPADLTVSSSPFDPEPRANGDWIAGGNPGAVTKPTVGSAGMVRQGVVEQGSSQGFPTRSASPQQDAAQIARRSHGH